MDAPLLDLEDEDMNMTETQAAEQKLKQEFKKEQKCFIGVGNNPRLVRDALT
jgi:hypothetical protein